MKNHSFDDLLRQKTSGHEASVPAGTWEAIAQKKRKKRRFLIFWWITGVSLVSGAMLLAFYKNQPVDNNNVVATANSHETSGNTSGKTIPEKNESTENNNEKTIDNKNDKDKGGNIVNAQSLRPGSIKNKPGIFTPASEQKISSLTISEKERKRKSKSQSLVPDKPEPTTGTAILSPVNSKDNNAKIRPGIITEEKATYVFTKGANAIDKKNKHRKNNPGPVNNANDQPGEIDISPITVSVFSFNYQPHAKVADFNLLNKLGFANPPMITHADSVNSMEAALAKARKKYFKKSKWTLDASVTPFIPVQQSSSLLYLTRSNTTATEKTDYKTDKISSHLLPSVAYTVAISKKITPRWRIGAGLQYVMIKEKVDLTGKQTKITYTEVQRLINGSSGPQLIIDTIATTSSGSLSVDALNSYRFLSIPVSVQYRLMEKASWSYFINAGMLVNVSADYHNKIEGKLVQFDNHGMHTGQQKNNMGFDLFAGFRVSKSFNSFNIFAEPMLRYNLHRYDLDNMIGRKFMHQAGLSVGLTYPLVR
jgi:hypothetical protein